jgi:hypothetical protein
MEERKHMTEPERTEDSLFELIQSKVVVDNVDSGWMIAFVLMKTLLILKEISDKLTAIDSAIAPDLMGHSLTERFGLLSVELRDIAQSLKKLAEARR